MKIIKQKKNAKNLILKGEHVFGRQYVLDILIVKKFNKKSNVADPKLKEGTQ